MSPPGPRARAPIVAAFALVLPLASAACTVLSGWSDLQGGARDGGDAGALDAGAVDGRAALDSGSCANACAPAACCRGLGGTATTCEQTCGSGAVTLSCVDEKDCAGAHCCQELQTSAPAGYVARCALSCSSGAQMLCDPLDPGACPGGTTCKPASLAPYACQP
jgi:hypothetical protein